IVSATLAVGVLAAGLLTVYLIDRRQVDQSLAASARRAAADLSASGLHASASESEDELVSAYLQGRSGSGQLLAVVAPGGRIQANSALAQRLWRRRDLNPGDAKRIEMDGEDYVVSSATRNGSRFI